MNKAKILEELSHNNRYFPEEAAVAAEA